MAQKKTDTKAERTAAKKKSSSSGNDETQRSEGTGSVFVSSFILIIIALITGVCFYTPFADGFGEIITEFFGSLFGAPVMTIPAILLALGIYVIAEKRPDRLSLKGALSLVLLMLFSGIWELFAKSDAGFAEALNDGSSLIGGGIAGWVICEPLRSLVSSAICGIILICLFILLLILTTKFNVLTFLRGLFSTVKEESVDIRSDESYEIGRQTRNRARERVDNLRPLKNDKIDFDVFDSDRPEKADESKPALEAAEKPAHSDPFDVPIFDSSDETRKHLEDIDASFAGDSNKSGKTKKDSTSPENDASIDTDIPEVKATKEAAAIMEAEAQQGKFGEKKPVEQLTPKEEKNLREKLDRSAAAIPLPYKFPPVSLLSKPVAKKSTGSKDELRDTGAKLVETLKSFGVDVKLLQVSRGPTVTRYELQPNVGVKVSKITSLSDDIALNLAAQAVRIEAPIPGKAAIGIEIPNKEVATVTFREVIETDDFKNAKSKLSIALGIDIAGKPIIGNIAKMPHVLIAGATGSGKSVCINSIVASILYKADPNEVKLMMVDPKMVELAVYNGIPHLLIPVVTDAKKASGALSWAVSEMTRRYNLFAENGVRDLTGYNEILELDGEAKLPQIVIIIDELADLMMVAPKEIEDSICRLAQMARAAGMHLIIATQRPSVNVITGVIKANIPSRIAFAVSSYVDSKTILDSAGAEKLLGKGDMLFMPMGASKPTRLQGAFLSDKEVEEIVEYTKKNSNAIYDEDIQDKIDNSAQSHGVGASEEKEDGDELLPKAIEIAVSKGQISTSYIQRALGVGYARAGRIIDQMEARGIISGADGAKPRNVLVSSSELYDDDIGSDIESDISESFEDDE